jgi:hypothetical protein
VHAIVVEVDLNPHWNGVCTCRTDTLGAMMHRFFLILVLLGLLTACIQSTPAAQAPQVIGREPASVATVEITRVVTQVVIATPTSRPAEPTVVASEPSATPAIEPTAMATEPPVTPTIEPAAVATAPSLPPAASVVNGGNLRSEARVAAATVMGQVCPGDQVEVLAQQRAGTALWYKVRVTATQVNCDATRVAVGTQGWLNSSLLSSPSADVDYLSPTTAPDQSPVVPGMASQASIVGLLGQWQLVEVESSGKIYTINPKTEELLFRFMENGLLDLQMRRDLGYKVQAMQESGTYAVSNDYVRFDVVGGSRILMEVFGVTVIVMNPSGANGQPSGPETLNIASCQVEVRQDTLICRPRDDFALTFRRQ